MNRRVRIVVAAVVLVTVGALAWWAWGPQARGSRMLSGYVEGEALYLSSATAGTLGEVSVRRGQRVAATVDAALGFAQNSPWPAPGELTTDVYA